jgi:ATP-binding cassette subfamily F protein 3
MLNLIDVALRRGPRLLFANASLTVHAGERVGLIGANGSGKSSLFALIRGELHTEHGELQMPPATTIAHVAQETPALPQPAIDYVLDGDKILRALQARLAVAEAGGDGDALGRLHAEMETIDGYTAASRAASLLHGLGFAPGDGQRPVAEFSGGWRMRLNLARALIAPSNLLLLDEPTNHLDLEATLWLEEWLRHYAGTLLLISHDREFLDRVVDRILSIDQGGLRLYAGNYSEFELRRAEHLAQQQAAWARQQRELARIHRFVERFRAKATKARAAQSRLKALARMEIIVKAHVDSPFGFELPPPDKLPRTLLRLSGARIGYDRAVLDGVELMLAPGDRVGLLGANGAGKSSLIKTLAGELPVLAGQRDPAQDLRIGYFAQHQLEQLQPGRSPLAHLRAIDARASEQSLRDFLGGFGFSGETVNADVALFSGGERARLVLAAIVYQRPNLLLLDEPTNHLDLEMRQALTMALQDYEGAIVLVAHDRHLLRNATDRFLLVGGGRVAPYAGDIDDYRLELRGRDAEPGCADDRPQSAVARAARKRLEAERRQRLSPLRNRLKAIETELERASALLRELDQALADPALYGENDKSRLKDLLAEQARLRRLSAGMEEEWLALGAELEALEQS